MKLRVGYGFHPVGQGLFSSGVVLCRERTDQRFHWVYDCGSSTTGGLLPQAVKQFILRLPPRGPKPVIDLVTISHFDRDHIDGFVALLPQVRIESLLLPYMPLWERLTIAAAEGIGAQEPLFAFFVNPVAYLTGIDGGEIGQIILVPESDNEGPPGGGEGAPVGPEDGEWHLDVDDAKPAGADQQIDDKAFRQSAGRMHPQIRFMRSGGALRVGVWEFVPYNDARLAPKATDAFRRQIAALQIVLVDSPPEGRATALEQIKKAYEAIFTTHQQRNEISLFLYGGPLRNWSIDRPVEWALYLPTDSPGAREWRPLGQHLGAAKVGILYTGDGYLKPDARADRLLNYLGRHSRARQFGALQVMHHGARGNWYRGVAALLDPHLSIFSSDPTRKNPGHPHQEVWDDFSLYNPIQVDTRSGCYIRIELNI